MRRFVMDSVISVENVKKKFGKELILQDINLEVERGKIYGIIGRNGSGKSVLFKLICGLLIPDSGTIRVFNEEISKGNFPRDIGILLDSTGFMPYYSAFDNLKVISSINGLISNEEIKECIRCVGLDPEDKKNVKKYSVGMRQRLGIAQAIMERPKLLLLDEPMNGLDEEGVSEIRALLLKMNQEKGITIVMTSHNREDIDILCDKVYKMESKTLTSFAIK